MSMGLLQFESNAEYLHRQEAEQLEQQEKQRQQQIESSISGHIRKCWEHAKQAKDPIEKRLLDCLRRVKGEYTQEKLRAIQEEGGSEIYMMLTQTKVRAAESWIRDILIPVGEQPWGLDPTPIADVPPEYKMGLMQQVYQAAEQMQAQGEQVPQEEIQRMLKEAEENLKKQAQAMAEKAAERMELLIEDQLAEGEWTQALEQFIADFAMYPAAIMKGPVLRSRKVLAWGQGWQPMRVNEIQPEFERVSPFDLYPSPDAISIDDGSYLIERVRFTRAHLNALLGVEGYSEEAIREVLRDYGQGGLRDWLWNDSERARLEGRKHELLSPAETIDGLEYHGGMQGLTLLQWGMSPELVPDPLAEYEVEAILIGRHCVRCVINDDPTGRRPYHKASFNPIPGSFWGTAIPELMADVQDVCNATARSLINNMAVSSGPQFEIYTDRLAAGENAEDVRPLKVWKMKSDRMAGSGNSRAINFFQPNSNSGELLNVYSQFEQKADDATNIPRYIYGNEKVGGAGNTATGLSMLMESANKGIKAAINHIDSGVIRRVIEALWLHNMLYSDDQSIKGDCKVIARGSSAMLQREQHQMMKQQLFQNLANPEIVQQALGVRGQVEMLRGVLEGAGMHGVIRDDIETEIEQAKQQPSQQDQLAMAELEAKVQKIQAEAQRIGAQAQSEQAKQQMQPAELEKLQTETLKLAAEIQKIAAGIQNDAINAQFQRMGSPGAYGAQQPTRLASPQQMAAMPPSGPNAHAQRIGQPHPNQPSPGGMPFG